MKFSELRKKRLETPVEVKLEDGTVVEVFVPSVDGVRKVHEISAEIQANDKENKDGNRESISRSAELAAWMLIACSPHEKMEIKDAEQAIFDTGGVLGPVAKTCAELVYSKEAGEALAIDPTSSGDASVSTQAD